jgi:hypothetical protein
VAAAFKTQDLQIKDKDGKIAALKTRVKKTDERLSQASTIGVLSLSLSLFLGWLVGWLVGWLGVCLSSVSVSAYRVCIFA